MIKRMLIDNTQPEETRVVVINGNKVEDVEFESSSRRQIKGNIYLAKVMRVEPSLQACFVDYGGNKHGFLAFGEIHPDYYTLSQETVNEIDREVDEIIENKKKAIKEREQERERIRQEKALAREEKLRAEAEKIAEKAAQKAENQTDTSQQTETISSENSASVENENTVTIAENTKPKRPARTRSSRRRSPKTAENSENAETLDNKAEMPVENTLVDSVSAENALPENIPAGNMPTTENSESVPEEKTEEISNEDEENGDKKKHPKKRLLKKRFRKQLTQEDGVEGAENSENKTEEPLKVMTESTGCDNESVSENVEDEDEVSENNIGKKSGHFNNENDDDFETADDDDEDEIDFELQRKLIKARKLFHKNRIQDVVKEGQILLVQVVKEERGNKGAALTTYLSLAGRYCVLMPNRIKSGGVSRKITNAADRNRLKGIVKELPLTSDMSIIVRTAGEEKTKADIVRDYNYLIRTWNQVRIASLKSKAPSLIHEEGNLIKRALRDIYTKDISEIIVAGEEGYQQAKEFFRILSPHSLKKIKSYHNSDMPLFHRFQVEGQLDKLHDPNAQLESGGYLVINPTEALISIDVNSGRATKEKDLEETALKTNLEACDEIARQLRLRNLAGLVVIDFIDMDEPSNNHAIEKRMKEALKKDRSRIQVGKMSMFGLLELSRQRMHSSFFESNYQVCPFCQGRGMIRTTESSAVFVLRGIEEEGIKNRSSRLNVYVPADIAIYLLNQKRQMLIHLEQKYKMEVIISADNSIKCVAEYKIERSKISKSAEEEAQEAKTDKPEKAEKSDENRNRGRNRDRNRPAPKEEVQVLEQPQAAQEEMTEASETVETAENGEGNRDNNYRRRRKDNRCRGRGRFDRRNNGDRETENESENQPRPKQEAVILYNSHEDIKSTPRANDDKPAEEKSTWWKKLIKG